MAQDGKNTKTREHRKGERLAKVIARSGLASRREAEEMIRAARVAVNGWLVLEPATNVTPDDEILVDGEPLPAPEPVRLWRYHKPRGRIVARRDPQGRPTIYDDLPAELARAQPVGRLDFNSEGLLLLTNDGALKRALELPERGWTRRYRVRAFGRVHPRALARLQEGIVIDGVHYGPIRAELEVADRPNKWLTFALKEGRNREIRRICEHLGLQVSRLIRTSYGPFQLGRLPRATVEEVPRKQMQELLGGLLEEVEAERFARHPKHDGRKTDGSRR